MVASGNAIVTPSNARDQKRRGFVSTMSVLVAAIRRASQHAEAAILQSADRKWFRDNPEGKPPPEFTTANDTHLAELETAKAALLRELDDAIEKSRAFD